MLAGHEENAGARQDVRPRPPRRCEPWHAGQVLRSECKEIKHPLPRFRVFSFRNLSSLRAAGKDKKRAPRRARCIARLQVRRGTSARTRFFIEFARRKERFRPRCCEARDLASQLSCRPCRSPCRPCRPSCTTAWPGRRSCSCACSRSGTARGSRSPGSPCRPRRRC